jgi:Trypsin-like peptidase domain
MRRIISSATSFVTILFAFCAPYVQAQQPQRTVSEVVKATVDSVVLIVVSDDSGNPVAEGSGFIASSDGKIVTNHHVIDGAHSALVRLNNGAFFMVDGVLADDPDHDIAVLKVSGKNLPTLQLADSDSLSAGDHVVAIGSPLGLENSISDGIISAFRKDPDGRSWIQTTAPTSQGNSGGPLLTMDEKVAGIITWKATEGENLTFAVPSKVIPTLLTDSTVRPLGTASTVSSNSSTLSAAEKEWISITGGSNYKIHIDGDYIYVRWTNLPPKLQSTPAFITYKFKKSGDKWVGRKILNVPVTMGQSKKWCWTELNAEIDKVTDSRIEGRSEGFSTYNAKCQPEKVGWKPFTWIRK